MPFGKRPLGRGEYGNRVSAATGSGGALGTATGNATATSTGALGVDSVSLGTSSATAAATSAGALSVSTPGGDALGTSTAVATSSSTSTISKISALSGDYVATYTLDAGLTVPTSILVPAHLSTYKKKGVSIVLPTPRVVLGRPYISPSFEQAMLDAGPRAWYKLNGNDLDSSGNDFHGSRSASGAGFTGTSPPGVEGNQSFFPTPGYFLGGSGLNVHNYNTFSIEYWFRTHTTPNQGRDGVKIHMWSGQPGNPWCGVTGLAGDINWYIHSEYATGSVQHSQIWVTSKRTTTQNNSPGWTGLSSVYNSSWHHLAVSYTKTSVTLWVDGVSQGTKTQVQADGFGLSGGSTIQIGVSGFSCNWFYEYVSNAAYFTRLLTDSEVAERYSLGSVAAA